MLFGHNSNVKVANIIYHIQTEDHGLVSALIDTTVYFHGRVLHRRVQNYFDLLPLNAQNEQALKLRINEQHSTVIKEVQSGVLQSAFLSEGFPASTSAGNFPASLDVLGLELLNSKNWLVGKKATLDVAVKQNDNGACVGKARVAVRVDGAAEAQEYVAETAGDGRARLEFEMPSLTNGEASLVIEARKGLSKGHVRFQLRARRRVPSGG